MTKGKQEWKRLDDPYDQVFFPPDDNVAQGRPNHNDYEFNTGTDNVISSLISRVDPNNEDLKKKCETWMELCTVINEGFTHLGISRVVPSFLHFLLRKKIVQLYKLASYTVRDVQYAVFNLGYSIDDLLNADCCPAAPAGPEPDPILRRVKGVLNHPIGDYAVQPRVATFAAQAITMAHYAEGAAYTVGEYILAICLLCLSCASSDNFVLYLTVSYTFRSYAKHLDSIFILAARNGWRRTLRCYSETNHYREWTCRWCSCPKYVLAYYRNWW